MKLRIAAVAAATVLTLTAVDVGHAAHVIFEQDFSSSTTDWSSATSNGDGTATVPSGAFSRFGEYRTVWPGDHIAELDVYVDPAWTLDSGFEYSVAVSGTTNVHRRDFIFHLAMTASGLRVKGDNNATASASGNAFVAGTAGSGALPGAGWYTLQHVFQDDAGVLRVTMNVLDANGDTVYTTDRSDPSDVIGTTVGGNRYGWFVYSTASIVIDNQSLYLVDAAPHGPSSKDDCKQGGWESYGTFTNQGDCIASVVANDNSGK